MPFCPNSSLSLRNAETNIIGISSICLWYFFKYASILNKIVILGQPPRETVERF